MKPESVWREPWQFAGRRAVEFHVLAGHPMEAQLREATRGAVLAAHDPDALTAGIEQAAAEVRGVGRAGEP